MAKRSQRDAVPKNTEAVVSPVGLAAATSESDEQLRFAIFRVSEKIFAFHLSDVIEITRVPALARMPLAPSSLLGLCNLRGNVLPIVSLSNLLGLASDQITDTSRIIIIERGGPVGYAVDRIDGLTLSAAQNIGASATGAGGLDPELIDGVLIGDGGGEPIRILNPGRLLRNQFANIGVANNSGGNGLIQTTHSDEGAAPSAANDIALVTFELGEQEYGLPLDRVREILTLPEHISDVPHTETAVLGVVTLRNRLLPLVSLRRLLGMPDRDQSGTGSKVIVMQMGGGAVGFAADQMREILRIEEASVDEAPALLSRGTGQAQVKSLCRLDGGKRLVAMLDPDNLFNAELTQRVLQHQNESQPKSEFGEIEDAMAEEQFIIFRLGEQEYGLSISAVEEIARPPERVTRFPRAPSFVDGIINLRGTVVPVIDLAIRFKIDKSAVERNRRILILNLGGGRTGFLVDGVSEILKIPTSEIQLSPELSPAQTRLIGRVANLTNENRMVLLIDASQLLNQIETDVLTQFDRADLAGAQSAS